MKKGFEKGGKGERQALVHTNAHIYMISPITLKNLMKKTRQKGEEEITCV
jgi:hypothetical protein